MSRNGSSAQERSKEDEEEGDPVQAVVDEPPSAHCSHRVPPCHRYPVIRIARVPSGVWVWLAVGDNKVAGSISVSWCR